MPESLPLAESLNVLMIALGDEVLTGWGDTRERHLEYAAHVAHLHMVVYSPRGRNLPETPLSEHLTVYPTRSATRPGFVWDAYRIGARICRTYPINVITTHDPFTTGLAGVLLKKQFGIPLDVQNHSYFFDNPYWIAERPLRHGSFNRLGRWVIRQADTHRVVTEAEKAKYIVMGIDPARIVVRPTPVRLDRFSPDGPAGESVALRRSMGIPEDAPVLLWVGKPVQVKRVSTLIEAFAKVHARHPEAHLVLVGDFSAQSEIRRRVEGLGLDSVVHFPGQVEHTKLPEFYRMCSLFVLSSVTEGMPKVIIEALSCAKPVVCTRIPVAPEIIKDGETGLLCELENPRDMAAKIDMLLDDPAWAAQMGAKGRAFVLDKFDHNRSLEEVVETWRRAAALAGRS